MPKLSSILIGVVLASILITGFGLFLSGGVATYGTAGYDNTSVVVVGGTFDDIEQISQDTQGKLLNLSTSEAAQNKLDLLFAGAYSTGYTIAGAVSTIYTIAAQSQSELSPVLGEFGSVLKNGLIVIVLIVVFIAILMHFIIKSDRL